MDELNPWIKRFERERTAKKAAEKLLEEKSLELYLANQSLEERVQQRTLELQEALKSAQLAQNAKDTFLASMSHELRTPLNSIIGFSQILSMQKDVPEKILSFVNKINISGNHLLKLVTSILNFSKLESNEMKLQKEEFALNELIDELCVLIQVQVERKNIKIHLDVEDININADKLLLNQALLNILSNAAKFTHENGNIKIVCKKEADSLYIEICDDGVGISDEDQVRLFQAFVQIQNVYQAHSNGTGLGLYFTRKIVELHGGEIKVQSELDKGTCFIITL